MSVAKDHRRYPGGPFTGYWPGYTAVNDGARARVGRVRQRRYGSVTRWFPSGCRLRIEAATNDQVAVIDDRIYDENAVLRPDAARATGRAAKEQPTAQR